MEVPRHVRERLEAYDRHLFLRWNGEICRWELWRHEPVKTSDPPYLVCVYQKEPERLYLPLDDRLFAWLRGADLQHRFRDRDRKYWANLYMAEIEEQNRLSDVANRKAVDEKYAGARDEMEFAARKDLREGNPVPRTVRRQFGPAKRKVPI